MKQSKGNILLKFARLIVIMLTMGFVIALADLNAKADTSYNEVTVDLAGLSSEAEKTVENVHVKGAYDSNYSDGIYISYGSPINIESTDDRAILSVKVTVILWAEDIGYMSSSVGKKTIENNVAIFTDINSKSVEISSDRGMRVGNVIVETSIPHNVTLNTNGGTIKAGNITMYAEGKAETLPTNIFKDGYIFDGWYANSGCTGSPVTSILTTDKGDKSFWAKWITLEEFAAQSGITISNYADYYDGESHKISITGSLSGYTIKYSTDGINFDLDENPSFTEVSDNLVYFKLSKENQKDVYGLANVNIWDVYYIVGDFSGGERLDDYLFTNNPKPFEDVEEWYINEAMLTAGDKFRIQGASGKWFPASESNAYEIAKTGSYNIRFRPNADGLSSEWFNKYFIVKYNIPTHAVTFNTNDGTINSGEIEKYTEEEWTALPTDVTKDGFVFAGWFDNEELEGNAIGAILKTDIGPKTYWAKWVENVAQVGENQYASFAEAYNNVEEGGTIKLLSDINLIAEDFNYIVVDKNITIDLNGHILNLTSDTEGRYKMWVVDGKNLTINNTEPATGGILGSIGVKSQYGAKVYFENSRFDCSLEEFKSNDGYVLPENTV